MYIGAISMRYARALLMFANEAGVAATVYREALTLRESFRKVPEFRQSLEKPVMSREDKRTILKQAAGGNISIQMQKFFDLVIQEKRERFLMYINQSFIDLYRKQEKIRVGKLTTAVPIASEEVERIRKIVVDAAGGTAEFATKVDPSIEGGFIFEINTYRLDASVSDQMRRIKQQFIEKNRRIV
ncbi:MAG: F0F1 ATP synthase subunit delta [Bacteroidaceae bacterium]|nr:F0F1 ATP synthase subunit delta [Bacteroidaceae bacterium]